MFCLFQLRVPGVRAIDRSERVSHSLELTVQEGECDTDGAYDDLRHFMIDCPAKQKLRPRATALSDFRITSLHNTCR